MFGIKTRLFKLLGDHVLKEDLNTYFGPKQVRISPVGYACSHKCPMCWRSQLSKKEIKDIISSSKKDLEFSDYINLIRSLPRSVKTIEVVGGGEPLLFPKISQIFREIKKNNFQGRLITNGSLLSKTNIDSLINISWDYVRVSFHAATGKAYKLVHGVDHFDKVIKNIKMLLKKRGNNEFPKVYFLFVIQKSNYHEKFLFTKLMEKIGIDGIEFDSLLLFVPQNLILTDKDRNHVIKTLNKLQDSVTIKNNIKTVLRMLQEHPNWGASVSKRSYFQSRYCHIVQSNVDIFSNGAVLPCCLTPVNSKILNIKEYSLKEIWNEYRPLRVDLKSGNFKRYCYSMCNYDLAKRN